MTQFAAEALEMTREQRQARDLVIDAAVTVVRAERGDFKKDQAAVVDLTKEFDELKNAVAIYWQANQRARKLRGPETP